MLLLVLLLLVFATPRVLGEELECVFVQSPKGYACENSEMFEENAYISTVSGTHQQGLKDTDVNFFEIPESSETRFLPLEVCSHLSELVEIVIHGPNIIAISREVFAECDKVLKVVISGTMIQWWPENALHDLPNMIELNLSNNQLLILQDDLLSEMETLQSFVIDNNSLEPEESQLKDYIPDDNHEMNDDRFDTNITLQSRFEDCRKTGQIGVQITSSTGLFLAERQHLQLTCNLDGSVKNDNVWWTKNGEKVSSNNHLIVSKLIYYDACERTAGKTLIIHNVDEQRDNGNYGCVALAPDNNTYSAVALLTIVEVMPSNFTQTYDEGTFNGSFSLNVEAYPSATFIMYDVFGDPTAINEVAKLPHHSIEISRSLYTFSSTNPRAKLSSNFTLVIKTIDGCYYKHLFELLVLGKPEMSFKNLFKVVGKYTEFRYRGYSYPKASINCSFRSCANYADQESCLQDEKKISKTVPLTLKILKWSKVYQRATISFNRDELGYIQCSAVNIVGDSFVSKYLKFTDLDKPVVAFSSSKGKKIVIGDHFELECASRIESFWSNVVWTRYYQPITNTSDMMVIDTSRKYSWRSTIVWKSITKDDEGPYGCRTSSDTGYKYLHHNIRVYSAKPIKIHSNFKNTVLHKDAGDSLVLRCKATGLPDPNIVWLKDDKVLVTNKTSATDKAPRISKTKFNRTITFTPLRPEDSGTYKCQASNRIESIYEAIRLEVRAPITLTAGAIAGIVIVVVVLICSTSFLVFRVIRQRKQVNELIAAGLAYFEEGNLECIDPNGNLDEQADLLPYDKSFEFPIESLKLGKQLGAGAFGVVLQATAQGIVQDEDETTVAVKMLKKLADNETVKALVIELKIMIHLGKHENVINLLGAVTKNIAKRELMVIVEFCPHGNLNSFLIENRKYFVNQLQNDQIDSKVEKVSLEIAMNETSNKAINFCTSDLINWSIQIARGMNYLASKKVLHGDLAARNVLLCDNNVVKICDFGLARSLYKNDQYKKTSNGLVPFKWLAIESIMDHVFTTYSDVWSYGIMLWELFSLGSVPYPGIEANEELFHKIHDGYRMDKPQYANIEIFDVMLDCWKLCQETRPLFQELESRFYSMLQENDRFNYHLVERTSQLGQGDYISPLNN